MKDLLRLLFIVLDGVPMFERTVSLTVCDRPHYLRRTLDSLARNDLRGWHLVIALEPGSAACASLCHSISFMPKIIIANPERLGVRGNPFNLLDYVFYKGSRLNVYVEDDLVLAPDALALAAWYGGQLAGDVLDGRRTLCMRLFVPSRGGEPCEAVRFEHEFAPIGFVLGREQWQRYFRPVWFDDAHQLAPSVGWDWSVQARLRRDPELAVAAPALSRSNHIGDVGTHMTPAVNRASYGHVVLAAPTAPVAYRIEA
jgi:hypothetical protein